MSEFIVKIQGLPKGCTQQQLFDFLKTNVADRGTIRALHGEEAEVVFANEKQAKNLCLGIHNKSMVRGKKIQATLVTSSVSNPQPTVSTEPGKQAMENPNPATPPATTVKSRESLPLLKAASPAKFAGENRQTAPYCFVPVLPKLALTSEPVYHDRLHFEREDQTDWWTGELQIELEALTPLLAANDQYPLSSFIDRQRAEELIGVRLNPNNPTRDIKEDKHILEPLALPGSDENTPGPLLINGSAIKGPIRQSLGALLCAPMERVQERTFSYRPNVKLDPLKDDRVKTGVGVVVEVTDKGMEVLPLSSIEDVAFVAHSAVVPLLEAWGIDQDTLDQRLDSFRTSSSSATFKDRAAPLLLDNLDVPGTGIREQPGRLKLVLDRGATARLARRWLMPYRFGLDGKAIFYRAFKKDQSLRGYPYVLVRNFRPHPIFIPKELVDHWLTTLSHLSDEKTGHLVSHPNIDDDGKKTAARAINKMKKSGAQVGDVFYFEVLLDQQGRETKTILSIGHHFRYRWRYRDTTHRSCIENDVADFAPGGAHLRNILCPLPLEQPVAGGTQPQALSGARLIFGYVGTSEGNYKDNEPLTFGVGQKGSDFTQLAGRLRINTAVEQDEGRKDRFLGEERFAWLVPLRALGSPKPSAVEFYLTQDRERQDAGILNTYGDTLDDNAAGQLNGRKFYLHQSDAVNNAGLYELLSPADGARAYPDVTDDACRKILLKNDGEMLKNNQAAFGRFISRPTTKFHFTLRFTNLRAWELGALLFVLQPTAKDIRILAGNHGLPHWFNQTSTFAHKLGHGRPLGLGSVTLNINALNRLTKDPAKCLNLSPSLAERDALIQAFAQFIQTTLGEDGHKEWVTKVLWPWLEAHRYGGRTHYDYPREKEKDHDTLKDYTIYAWHTALRRKHAGGRKKKKTGGGRSPHGIKPPIELP